MKKIFIIILLIPLLFIIGCNQNKKVEYINIHYFNYVIKVDKSTLDLNNLPYTKPLKWKSFADKNYTTPYVAENYINNDDIYVAYNYSNYYNLHDLNIGYGLIEYAFKYDIYLGYLNVAYHFGNFNDYYVLLVYDNWWYRTFSYNYGEEYIKDFNDLALIDHYYKDYNFKLREHDEIIFYNGENVYNLNEAISNNILNDDAVTNLFDAYNIYYYYCQSQITNLTYSLNVFPGYQDIVDPYFENPYI